MALGLSSRRCRLLHSLSLGGGKERREDLIPTHGSWRKTPTKDLEASSGQTKRKCIAAVLKRVLPPSLNHSTAKQSLVPQNHSETSTLLEKAKMETRIRVFYYELADHDESSLYIGIGMNERTMDRKQQPGLDSPSKLPR
jgi:hypothetical protein